MTFLRYLLVFALVYYLFRILGRAFFSGKKRERFKPQDGRNVETDYSDKTDQKIEDADFEDLK